ncbi:MAG: hypothetical protein R3192_08635 [Woeseiaceae bacterium]|nr:hypothetical protein [Woeseiaceae bacterium]
MLRTTRTVAILAGIALTSTVIASDIEGRWTLSVQDKQRTLVGLLEIEKAGDGYNAWLEGGPATVEVDGDDVVITADSRDIRGFVFDRRMVGKIDGDKMNGTYTQVGAAASTEDPGPWSAVRGEPKKMQSMAPRPEMFAGTWTATQELDFRKYTMSLTPAGEAWLESYLPYYDQPDVRCTSVGLPALTTYSFPFEIIYSKDRYTMIYEYESIVRRIWMDGREPSEYMPPSRMGHSNGRWENGTLVIETRNLEKTVRDFRGELIGENARIVERYDLSEDGNTLTMVVTVHDPENYKRPPVRRRMWKRDDSAEIFPYKCDPDSFYIKMYEEGEMDMYIERTDKRF